MRYYNNDDLRILLSKFRNHLECWKVGLSFGSFLYFEMGDKLPLTLENGSVIEVGSSTLVLESDEWEIRYKDIKITDSASVNTDLVERLIWKYFVKRFLASIVFVSESKQCRISFDTEGLTTDSVNIYVQGEADEDICTITFPDGTIIVCNAENGFVSDDSRSEVHAVAYSSKIEQNTPEAQGTPTVDPTLPTGGKVESMSAARHPTRPSERTIKRLFALSGNHCAFPKCTEMIVQLSTGIVLGEVCHIKAASPAGPRFDPQQSAAERHGYANLILMCAKHHTVIDDDEESYTVERLLKMKTTHESAIAAPIADDVAATAAKFLIQQPVVSVNQSGGITARTVYITASSAHPAQRDEAAERRAVLARIRQFHNERVKKLSGSTPQIPVLGGAVLIMHVVPIATYDDPQPKAFAKISADPNRFPPIVDRRPRDWKITFDGLTTGSNSEGLQKAQRAYVHIFRSGTVEAAISNLARGQERNFLLLPQLQSMIIHYSRVYAAALHAAGIQPPFAVLVSLLGVRDMRLLQDFIGTAIPEDLPYGLLTNSVYTFGEDIFDQLPDDDNESAKLLHDILSHLANTAQLARSPYFDDDGNYMLTVALPAG